MKKKKVPAHFLVLELQCSVFQILQSGVYHKVSCYKTVILRDSLLSFTMTFKIKYFHSECGMKWQNSRKSMVCLGLQMHFNTYPKANYSGEMGVDMYLVC